ncbi:MAG: DNA repair protein RecN [Xanthomonadales bacterium]|nr:DNA repair protein RecN [Xanthomonadales bacterium]
MLSFLQIRDFAIVKSLDLEFVEGFTCITGETGAGKSILVDALALLAGNRADTSAIRAGARRAELSAAFELREGSRALDWLRESELDDDHSCLLRRVISDNGRSRAWINGTPVTLQQLAGLGELLVEIHGQNEHIRLVKSAEQFRLLDAQSGLQPPLQQVREAYDHWADLQQEKRALLEENPLDAGDLDLLAYQIKELEEAVLPAAEWEALVQEHRRTARGGELVAVLEAALTTLDDEAGGAVTRIHETARTLESRATLAAEIADAAQLLREAAINAEEARTGLQSLLSRFDLSPERLIELERELATQHDLARKHRVKPEQLEDVLGQLRARFERAGSLDERLAAVDAQLHTALDNYREAAETLHRARRRRAAQLSTSVTDLLQQLGMAGGVFEFTVGYQEDAAPSRRGGDRLELKVGANRGTAPGPLHKVASGGELSRISLAIKVATKSGGGAHTQVFDEVDAGIGGETANAVGALLRSLSVQGQALCVTHLAQVAVHADHQIQVHKASDGREASVSTTTLVEEQRVDEIARMLGGRISEQSRAHASELLATALTRH